jgi:hypothetical protein
MTAARAAAFFLLVLGALRAEPLVDFPTDNHALLEGRPQDFFMYVNRDFEGTTSIFRKIQTIMAFTTVSISQAPIPRPSCSPSTETPP